MKYADIEKIHAAGLISEAQRQQIIDHFGLKEQGSKFLAIITMVAAVLIGTGIILLISANWDEIPRGVKIASGLLLMLGAHGGGWYLREGTGKYPKTGEALHLAGSLLFLGNIALIGQVYHLSSRPPNALLLWWVGIAALPWLLRSVPHHMLSLVAFGIWFGLEVNEPGSWIHASDAEQILFYALLGLLYLGIGYVLRRTRFALFSRSSENLGLLALLTFAYPLTWGHVFRMHADGQEILAFASLGVVAVALIAFGLARNENLTRQWRWTWGAALFGIILLLGGAFYGVGDRDLWDFSGYHWITAVGLIAFALLQVQVGLQERSSFMVNLGVAYVALVIFASYLSLFGSMAFTGFMFVVSGVLLLGLGIYLEKKRRVLVTQLQTRR